MFSVVAAAHSSRSLASFRLNVARNYSYLTASSSHSFDFPTTYSRRHLSRNPDTSTCFVRELICPAIKLTFPSSSCTRNVAVWNSFSLELRPLYVALCIIDSCLIFSTTISISRILASNASITSLSLACSCVNCLCLVCQVLNTPLNQPRVVVQAPRLYCLRC